MLLFTKEQYNQLNQSVEPATLTKISLEISKKSYFNDDEFNFIIIMLQQKNLHEEDFEFYYGDRFESFYFVKMNLIMRDIIEVTEQKFRFKNDHLIDHHSLNCEERLEITDSNATNEYSNIFNFEIDNMPTSTSGEIFANSIQQTKKILSQMNSFSKIFLSCEQVLHCRVYSKQIFCFLNMLNDHFQIVLHDKYQQELRLTKLYAHPNQVHEFNKNYSFHLLMYIFSQTINNLILYTQHIRKLFNILLSSLPNIYTPLNKLIDQLISTYEIIINNILNASQSISRSNWILHYYEKIIALPNFFVQSEIDDLKNDSNKPNIFGIKLLKLFTKKLGFIMLEVVELLSQTIQLVERNVLTTEVVNDSISNSPFSLFNKINSGTENQTNENARRHASMF